MHQVRNVLYQIKKESGKRSSPLYQPNHDDDDLREELAILRAQLRSKDTQIIRLHSQIDDLRQKVTLYQANSKASTYSQQESQQNQKSSFQQIPMIFENKELKMQNECLHDQNLNLNGKNNQLQAQLRQIKSDIKKSQSKLKQLQILEKMRAERFKDQLQKMTPIIIQDNKDFVFVKEGVHKVVNYLRQGVIQVIFQIFLRCAKEVEKEKATNSFSIFKNYWLDLKTSKNLGFLAALKSYESVKKLATILELDIFQLKQQEYRDTMNQWVMNTLIDIKHSNFVKGKEQKLFRYLGLLYRSKFPIKNELFELDQDLKSHFQDTICSQMLQLLTKS